VTAPSHAVFLSYASEDAQAAERICEALRAGGIEVWFDQSALRGGDAWDHSIRQQIKSCALFIPVISKNTHDRDEGYFRLEWKLAVDRCHLMAADRTFLLPVVIDGTRDDDERVPDRFREVQWTRLPGGEAPPAFVERVQHLLSGDIAATIRAVSSVSERPPEAPRSKHILPVAVVGAMAVALLGFFGLERLRESRPSIQGESIAVLPLANESGGASQEYFSDGISEDLITALSQLPGLKVIGRTSSFQFRDSKEDSRSIGTKLGVAHLLEGSVRRAGDMVRVSAELINTADDSTEWSERYDRPYNDLFALQDDITRAVAGALKAKLLPGSHAAAQSERPPGGSLEAYNAFLQGQFYYSRLTEADLRKAIDSFTLATQLDPHYAVAFSWLSRTWTSLSLNDLEGAPARDALAKARAAADRALSLSPELATAHLARGWLLYNADLDWRGAEAEFRRATELAPNDGHAKYFLGMQLATFGELEPAIKLTQEAISDDPLWAGWYFELSTYLSALNRLDEAERADRKAIELEPDVQGFHLQLTIIEVLRGNAQAALADAQQELPGASQDFALALARQIGPDRSAADAALKTLIDKDAGHYPFAVANIYAVRNDATETFAWLDRAWDNRDPEIGNLLEDPAILRFENDRRFAAFCKKAGLPQQSSASRMGSKIALNRQEVWKYVGPTRFQ
jgi:TolB-like protein/Tfp pilus assembly protein PilF